MILFENSILKLNYNPGTDILEIRYPDLQDFLLLEIKHSIDRAVEIIKNYDIKKVLLDSREMTSSVSEEAGRDIAIYLAGGLMKTRVTMVARIQSVDDTIEKRAKGNVSHLKANLSLPFKLETFTLKDDAIDWLKNEQPDNEG